ncbi:MAG: segregation/condensation protein A [Candidatus Woesearchaeota archaeon]
MNTILQQRPADSRQSHEKVVDIIFKEDDLNWKDLIYNVVREEGMNPWDVDVSLLSKKFIDMIDTLKEMDFRVSGKMVLTSSLLLKLKSDNLMNDGFGALDALINGQEESVDQEFQEDSFEYEQHELQQFLNDEKKLVARTPQPRERKVSVFDLVTALEQALSTDLRRQRVLSQQDVKKEQQLTQGKSTFDLANAMTTLQSKLKSFFYNKKTTVFFKDLLPQNSSKQETVFTFLPLLHLENQQKVEMNQKDHFGPIAVTLFDK